LLQSKQKDFHCNHYRKKTKSLKKKDKKMIFYKTNHEVELIRQSCLLVSDVLSEVASFIKPGVTTHQIDDLAGEYIQDHGAKPAFKGYRGFPAICCISLNDAVVHGIPHGEVIKEGDIVSVDTGTILNGYVGDSAYTFCVGEPTPEIKNLLKITKESLYLGIQEAVSGKRVGDIGWAVQNHTEKQNGYGVVRELTGHGLGKSLHEDPEVPNYGRRGNGIKLLSGLVIAIEPMINLGTKDVYSADDEWTIKTKDGSMSAHYEHTICVRPGKADILSSFEKIEANEKKNSNLFAGYY
jgi:methionyl aminopeptidase